MAAAFQFCFPFLFRSRQNRSVSYTKMPARNRSTLISNSPANQFNEAILKKIFLNLEWENMLACERVCKKWKRCIDKNIKELPKKRLDQIRVLFDEGEVILYPSDEKKTPTRLPMPSLRVLGRRLRHIHADSFLVRGLIPVEAIPVLRALCGLSIQPKQIYFIWSKFSPESMELLQHLLVRNGASLTDFGLEDCSPTNLLTDELIEPVLENLVSLRVWNDGKGGAHGVTDTTIQRITSAIVGGRQLETLDLSSVTLSPEVMSSMILAWISHATADMSISVTHSRFDQEALLDILADNDIFVEDGRIRVNRFCLTLFWRVKCQ